MQYTIPDYYKEFRCTADACEDTCCAGWQIVIDKKALREYRKIKGNFRKRMGESVDWRQSTFRQDEEKRCAFLNEENLCDLYANLGEKSLCRTCRLYPRHIEEFEGVREITLSVSCPEAAKILMEKKEPVTFRTYEKEGEEEYEEFDPFLYSMLADARESMIQMLQNRKYPVEVRVGMILGLGHDIQRRVHNQELFSCAEVMERYQSERAWKFVEKKVWEYTHAESRSADDEAAAEEAVSLSKSVEEQKRFVRAKKLFRKLYKLELLREDWEMLLREAEWILYGKGAERYLETEKQFREWQKENLPDMEIQLEQLLVYFVFTYFCGAVYDEHIYSKVQMAGACVFLIRELWKARWVKNGCGLDIGEMTEIVYRFSREVEHSDVNLKRIEKLTETFGKY